MGIFTGRSISYEELRYEMDFLKRRIMSLETILLEKERHDMGLTTDEDYKMWLRGRDQSIWALIMKRNREELDNE